MSISALSERRQPIILTKEERDRMVAEHPGEINEEADFIEYGTDAKDSSQEILLHLSKILVFINRYNGNRTRYIRWKMWS